MLAGWTGRGFGALLGLAVAFSAGAAADAAQAKARPYHISARHHPAGFVHGIRFSHHGRYAQRSWRPVRRWAGVLQCVPFARENSGIELSGNAGTWWEQAEGVYERGARPEVGSILNFRANGRMRLGHVAVVTNIISARHIEIDQANWSGPGRISRDINVVDVSPNNDWTAVRVALGQSEDAFGSVYPTYGFIYDRPDNGIMLANDDVTTAPADLRSSSERVADGVAPPEEVAEAPDQPMPGSSFRHDRTRRFNHVAHARFHARRHSHESGRALVYRVMSRSAIVSHHHHPHRHF